MTEILNEEREWPWLESCIHAWYRVRSARRHSCVAGGSKAWKKVRIGTDATYPPFESIDSRGEIVGWEIDYGRALCARMNVTCTFQNQDWDGIIPSLLGGKFDIILSGMSVTPARQEKVLFSDLYYAAPPVFVDRPPTRTTMSRRPR